MKLDPPSNPLQSNIETWRCELSQDCDRQFLLDGINCGFRITDQKADFDDAYCPNNKSTQGENKHRVEEQIVKEINRGAYIPVSDKPKIVSALGAIEKDNGKIRLIHDASRPQGKNLNAYVTTNKFQYQTIDNATKLLPKDGWMFKIDLSEAYRVVGIHPECYDATGLQWTFNGDINPTYMVDTRLMFGGAKSPEIFQRLSNAVVRMMKRRGFVCMAYLDDYLGICTNYDECVMAYTTLHELLQSLGFKINESKVIPPCQKLTFLGVDICAKTRTLSLCERKISELDKLLTHWRTKKSATKKELQRIVGKLNWAARVIRGGRTFLRRIITLMNSLTRSSHHTRINTSTRADFLWWSDFIRSFNGKTYFIEECPFPVEYFSTDAAGKGGAGHFGNDWYYANWEIDYPEIVDQDIWIKELFSVVLAARRWANLWQQRHVIAYTDNTVTKYCINSGTSKNSMVMKWLRELFWLSAKNNFYLTSRYIRSEENLISDPLSRLATPINIFKAAKYIEMPLIIMPDGRWLINLWSHVSKSTYLMLQGRMAANGTGSWEKSNNTEEKLMPNPPKEPTVQ